MIQEGGTHPIVVGGNNDGMGGFGGGWIGMLLILALLGGGLGFGRGHHDGGNRGGWNEALAFHDSSMQSNFLKRDLFDIEKSVLLQGERVTSAISTASMQNTLGQKDLQAQIAACCCETNRNIDSVRFDNERNTNRIIENATSNTQRLLDRMCADELRQAYARIAEQGQALSEARIISAMKPQAPIPAYLQPNPFVAFTGYDHGRGCPAGAA